MSKTLTGAAAGASESARQIAHPAESSPVAPATAPAGLLESSSAPWPSPRVAYYTLFVLILCLTSNQLDVAIVPYLAASIKADLHLSDTRLGFLMGASFALFYTIVGIPIAWFVDRYSRRWIIALGIATWNIGTALCGVAQNFTQLFAARFLVGAGEAVNGPASYSIIGDLFPRERMPRAAAWLQLGSVIGPAVAMIFGSILLKLFLEMKPIRVGFGLIHGWQLIFLIVGVPGALVAVLVLTTVPEPVRRRIPSQMTGSGAEAGAARTNSGLFAWMADYAVAFRYMRHHRGVFMPMFGTLLFSSLAVGGVLQWGPIFYQRTFGWPPGKVAFLQSAVQLVILPLGLYAGVKLSERFSRRKHDDAAIRVYLVARLIALPTLLYPLMPNPWLAYGLGALGSFALGMAAPSQNAALQIVTPAELRGKITALYIFIYSVVGIALSPLIPALIENYLLHSEQMIRWGIFWPNVIFAPISIFIAWLGLRPYGAEVARLKALEALAA